MCCSLNFLCFAEQTAKLTAYSLIYIIWPTEIFVSHREELSSKMSHLPDGLQNGLDHMPSTDSPPIDVKSHLDGGFASPSYPEAVTGYPQEVPGLPSVFHSPSPGPLELDTLPDVPTTPANTQGTGLLPSCTQPSGFPPAPSFHPSTNLYTKLLLS